MSKLMTVGMVGLDTSHVVAFSKLLNDPDAPHHVSGAKVIAGFPGGSKDMENSWGRVDRLSNELRDD
ncbi:gfo/Idh/MocA family oxidoreductase, partial [bacterium]|nr:gfo/Idh/MocA family oxidoreductase [bacterium]